MIEINLVPDVKLELLKVQRQRRMVVSVAIIASIVSGGVVVLLCLYAFGVQNVADALADNGIKTKTSELQSVEDLSKTLTIQNQLSELNTKQNDKTISSRLLDIVSVTVPKGDNSVDIRSLELDKETNTISIEAEAVNGYEALEVFKKTIAETTFQFNQNGEAAEPIKIAESISDGERQISENSEGQQVLRFSISFTYPEQLFSPESRDGKVNGPESQQVTDSARGVPTSLFGGDR